VAKGYEVAKGRYVEVTSDELAGLVPDEDHAAVAIESFVALDEVDPIYYDRAYYLAPDASPKAYALLHEVLSRSEKVAVARVMLRTRAHLALVRVLDNHLVLETMYFPAEIVDAADIEGAKKTHVDKKQLEVAETLVDSMTIPWEPERYKDEYTAKVKEVIEKKLEGGEVVESPLAPEAEGGKVLNLLDALRKSVEATRGGRAGAARVKSAPRRRAHAAKRSRARRG
jgi:DNA end-binding protein Ku